MSLNLPFICVLSFFLSFKAMFCFTNPDYRLIETLPSIRISEGLLYSDFLAQIGDGAPRSLSHCLVLLYQPVQPGTVVSGRRREVTLSVRLWCLPPGHRHANEHITSILPLPRILLSTGWVFNISPQFPACVDQAAYRRLLTTQHT
jgi:hypothetical protein